jgi:phospholipid/cholesterol/gamma-HCH transport system substrate-binding protein
VVTQAPKRSSIAIALAFTLSCVGLIIFVWTQFGGSIPFAPQGYRIKAVFNETGLLVPNADVRISGVNVGKVVSVQADGTHSLVTMNLEQQFAPIPTDTKAILRSKTLLGEAYLELSTGNGNGRKLPDGGTIPNSQVAKTQQLDQVLNSFTAPVQRDLQEVLIGTGNALNGRGQDLNDAFGNLGPATTELNAMIGVLNQQQGNLQSLISNSATVLTTLGDRGSQLQTLINAGNSVLTATASQNRALTGTVNALPPFLKQLRTSLTQLNTTLGIARPSLNALAPVAPLLTPALRGLTQLSGPLVTLLKSAPAVLRQAEVALPDITTFLDDLHPAVDAVLPAAQQIVPMINIISDYKQNLVTSMADLAAILQGQTSANVSPGVFPSVGVSGEAKYVRALITLGPDTLWGATTRSPAIRNNTYPSVSELARVGHGGEQAASCTGAGAGNVPCQLAPSVSWGHGLTSSYYPHVTKAAP